MGAMHVDVGRELGVRVVCLVTVVSLFFSFATLLV